METLLADLSVQLLPIAARVVATAIVVMGVSLLVQHAGPALGGIAAGLPIVMGPGFFFLIGHHPPDFLHDAAVATLMALVATLIFVACFIVVAKRAGPFASVGAAILAWCVVAAVTAALPVELVVALPLYVVVAILALRFCRNAAGDGPAPRGARRIADLVLRGILAGTLVASVSVVAALAGPVWAGLLMGFPIGMITISLTVHQRYGGETARQTMLAALGGMSSLAVFTTVMALAVTSTPPMTAWILSLAASLLPPMGLAARQIRRGRSNGI
ncbi:hypothetical protein PJ900_17640 [Tistrella mobilis]|uniref:Uncharacterized protein n=1 Tax=Tistrella mobilis TaxID=171437 RepID=A0A162KPI4_9PROT|nr:hypothetical protein [Tistrella mobilis]KYO51800.1 hypothetical protein AUP44_07640 [Tistrella mobilis]